MNKEKIFTKTFPIFLFSFILFCFSACSLKAEQKSLTSQFETIDSLIMQNQFADAVKDLKKIEKSAYDSWVCIGIYKRYFQLGELELGEKILKKSLKKNSKNLELNALMTKLLLSKNRIEEALEFGEILKGTDYGSIYSECVLREAALNKLIYDESFYKSEELYQIYLDAYKGSKNPIWLRNCAIFNITKGLYENAFTLLPSSFKNYKDALFWALVCYDSKHYYECVDVLDYAINNFDVDLVQSVALQSDAYIAISDVEAAELARQAIIVDVDSYAKNINADDVLMPNILVNSAIWAKNNGFENQCVDLLFYTVTNFPTYVPALILYSNYAYESNVGRKEDSEMLNLRNAGIFSSEMEVYDSRRKIPISDAQYRLKQALITTQNPYLSLAQLDLKYKLDKSLNQNDKLRDLWFMLEDNNELSTEYKWLLVQYAVNLLLSNGKIDDAWNVFINYVNLFANEKSDKRIIYGKDNVWKYFVENVHNFELPIIEIASYFATVFGLRQDSLRLLEYCVYESGGILESNVVSPYVSTKTVLNLANVYYSIGNTDLSLDLFGKAAGRESSSKVRSEIFYEIACIYAELGDKKNALRSVDYALSLFTENAKASLLKAKLQ